MIPKNAKVIELVDGSKFWSTDNWQTARDEAGRKVSEKRLQQLRLLQAFGAADAD